jgi:predicted dehydrogenase
MLVIDWAHEPMLLKARDIIQTTPNLGPVLYWHLRAEGVTLDGSKYQATEWRTVPDYQGGFILDGGVHSTAMLRTLLPTPPNTIISTAALHRTHLLPHDTITALALPSDEATVDPHGPPTALNAIRTANDVPGGIGKSSPQGIIFMSWALPDIPAESREPNGITVVCLNGQVTVRAEGTTERQWVINLSAANGSGVQSGKWSGRWCGVEREVGMFARAVAAAKQGKESGEENYGTPRGSLWDLAIIEACLSSNGRPVDVAKLIAGK